MDKSNIEKWVKALRSGKYKQTNYALQDNSGFCCLGVACDLFVKTKQLNDSGYIHGFLPAAQEHAPQWLKDINKMSINDVGTALSSLNDDHKLSFDEIADILEAVYLLEVLK